MSKTYIVESFKNRTQEKTSGHSGSLHVYTRINIRGNPNKGLVPVKIEHVAAFTYSEPLLLTQDEIPQSSACFNEQGECEVTEFMREFRTLEECHSWVINHFVLSRSIRKRLAGRCV